MTVCKRPIRCPDLFHRSRNGDEPEATYRYEDERGRLLSEVVRFPGKQFRQRRPDGRGGWIWNRDGVRRVLYRLPRVIEAVGDRRHVFVVEGEKDVAAIERAGHSSPKLNATRRYGE